MTIVNRAAGLTIVSVLVIALAVLLIWTQVVKSGGVPIVKEGHSEEFQKAFYQAARVYGRAGCGDQKLAEMTARYSIRTGLPPQLIAAMAASESSCNAMAISNRGAIGLTQVVPKIWSKQFDFTKINLLNPEDNMQVGTTILSGLVRDHGLKNGLARYYGTGEDGIGLGGAGYADKVLQLAGKL